MWLPAWQWPLAVDYFFIHTKCIKIKKLAQHLDFYIWMEKLDGMTTQQRQQTKDWALWFTFVDENKVKCVWCKESYAYKCGRAFAHYGYGVNSQKSLCTKAPITVKRRFANCGGVIPPIMTEVEINDTVSTF